MQNKVQEGSLRHDDCPQSAQDRATNRIPLNTALSRLLIALTGIAMIVLCIILSDMDNVGICVCAYSGMLVGMMAGETLA